MDSEQHNIHEEGIDKEVRTARMLSFDIEESVEKSKSVGEDNIEGHIGNGGEAIEDQSQSIDTPNPKLGMEFQTPNIAYDFYNEYARRIGFSIRKKWGNKNKFGAMKSRKFCCSREGSRKEDKQTVKQNRDSIRVNCNAEMVVSLQLNGKYAVSKFESTQNHQYTPKKAYMCRSRRQISVAQAIQTNIAESVGIAPKVAYDLISAQVGGQENVGFLPVDYRNHLRSKRMRSMERRDAGGILQHLQKMSVEDLGSFYAIQVDLEDQITNIFWADSQMVTDYEAFEDVVCFDTTYRTNNYDRSFAPFTNAPQSRLITSDIKTSPVEKLDKSDIRETQTHVSYQRQIIMMEKIAH